MLLPSLLAAAAALGCAVAQVPNPGNNAINSDNLGPAAWTRLNALLGQLVVNIGSLPRIQIPSGISSIDLDISRLTCGHFSIGSAKINAVEEQWGTQKRVAVTVTLYQVAVSCDCHWDYHYVIGGHGDATAHADPQMLNSLTVTAYFASPDFARVLPSVPAGNAAMTCYAGHGASGACTVDGTHWVQCQGLDITLDDLRGQQASGHMAALTVDHIVHDHAERAIEDSLNGKVCEQVGKLIPDILTQVLGQVNEWALPLMQYLDMPPTGADTMLRAEAALQRSIASQPGVIGGGALLSLRDNWLVQLAQLGANKLGAATDNALLCYNNSDSQKCIGSAMDSCSTHDARCLAFGFQQCQRDHPIRCRGPLVIDEVINTILPSGNGTLAVPNFLGLFSRNSTLRGDGDLIDVTVEVPAIRVTGLDSITRLELMTMIGDFTAFSAIEAGYLGLEMDVTITIQGTTRSSDTVDLNLNNIVEHVTVHTSIENPSMEVASMLAIRDSIKTVAFGDIVGAPLDCLLSSVAAAELTYANASIDHIVHPTIDGFISAGVDAVINSLTGAAFMMYEPIAENLLPGWMQTYARTNVNNVTQDFMAAHKTCPLSKLAHPPSGSQLVAYMNFSDLDGVRSSISTVLRASLCLLS
eukprot:COSAG01_NODE_839_length_13190_cov_138.958368_6_plen_640_part_00